MLCDVALDDDLATRFRVVVANDDATSLAGLLHDDRTLLGLSDAGAHASQLCDAVFATYLLEHWVRETGTLSLEKAVWRITGHPAAVFGMPGRGLIAPATSPTWSPSTPPPSGWSRWSGSTTCPRAPTG